LIKGYEFNKDHYFLLTDEDFDRVKVETSSMMTIEKFIDTDSIDPVYYDATHFVGPDGDAERDAYAVLREAVAKTGKAALGRRAGHIDEQCHRSDGGVEEEPRPNAGRAASCAEAARRQPIHVRPASSCR
jgi:hypothetical protein